MANPFEVQVPNVLQALMVGEQSYTSSKKARQQDAINLARQEAGKIYATGGDTKGVLGRLIGLGDSDTVKAIASMGPKSTNDMREYDLARQQGFKGSFIDYQLGLKKAGATRINNAITTGENAYSKTLNEARAKDDIGIQQAGRNAFITLGTLNRMEALTKDPNFSSGIGAEGVELPMRQLVARLGGNPNAASPMEEFRALSSKSALDGMGGSLGTGFSNADRDFIVNQYPNLQNTPEGNRARVEGLKKIEQRKIEISKRAREYARRNGGRLDSGFEDELAQWAEQNPIFRNTAVRQSSPSQMREGATAVNPQTGERIIFRGGQWVPAQ